MNLCTCAMSLAIAVLTACRSKASPSAKTGLGPVGQQVGVPDEAALLAAGRALGVQHHVDPRGGAGDVALALVVVLLLAADDLGHRPQHRDVRRRRVAAVGARRATARGTTPRAGP